VISLEPYYSKDTNQISALVNSIKYACEKVGFFIVTDHRVPQQLVEEHWQECFAFWNRPPQNIVAASIKNSPFVWLDFCPIQDIPVDEQHTQYHKDGWLLGPTSGRKGTKWRPDTSKMENLWMRYYYEMERLMKVIMSLFALALDLDEHFFLDKLTRHTHPLRSVFYPTITNPTPHFERAGEHTDWGCLTILKQDDNVSGLQIKKMNNTWSDVPLVKGSFVVNLGDLFPRWTNSKWKATAHRVILPEGVTSARMSIPFFGLVNDDTLVECIPSCVKPGESGTYPPIRADSFFSEHEKFSVYKHYI